MLKLPFNWLATKIATSRSHSGTTRFRLGVIAGCVSSLAFGSSVPLATAQPLAAALQTDTMPNTRPVPTPRQLAWQQMQYYAFVHFGPNTFTDHEWGSGAEDPNLFNPTSLDCDQWCKTFKAAGMKGVIITAKHHDGFCLWPSKYSTHTVAQSKWEGGKGDVLKELSRACKKYGLKMGVYLSPWDRNHPQYGTPEYNQVFANMLHEVLTNYGPIFEVWFDGANGEGPNGKKQVYDWPLFINTVRELQPNAVIFSDAGPDIRWVGNEGGIASETSWSTINRDRYVPGTNLSDELGEGDPHGRDWVPPECDVSIRPGWFNHSEEDSKVKTPEQLMNLYLDSVGRNGSLLLNVPANRQGKISAPDIASLMGFKKLRDEAFAHPVKAQLTASPDLLEPSKQFSAGNEPVIHDSSQSKATITMIFPTPTLVQYLSINENIAKGQAISQFHVDAKSGDTWKEVASGTTIGAERLLSLSTEPTTALRFVVDSSLAVPSITAIQAFAAPNSSTATGTEITQDQRMAWWRKARFGMFIHWGLYSELAGEWNGTRTKGAAEWIQHDLNIPVEQYEKLLPHWNPTQFNADAWATAAANAGMKYLVITSKHHEGFANWPSKQGTWNVGHTPFKRDPLAELSAACRRHGIHFGLYYSIMDWHNVDYLPRHPWDDRPADPNSFPKYVQFMKAQLKEIVTHYHPEVLWFDGEWENTWNSAEGKDLFTYLRKLDPKLIINNRVDSGRNGLGDFSTPEQTIPANGIPGKDWETCMTMNDTWGYSQFDNNWKSTETIIKNLVDIASKGGNYLLNVGPMSNGLMPEASLKRLAEVGAWMKVNGKAIYGTKAGPFPQKLAWGRVTSAPGKLYLFVFDPKATSVNLPGFTGDIRGVTSLANPAAKGSWTNTDDGVTVTLPASDADLGPVAVYEVNVAGDIHVTAPKVMQESDGSLTLNASDATISGDAQYESSNSAIGYWTDLNDAVSWTAKIVQGGTYHLNITYACDPASEGSTFEVELNGQSFNGTVSATKSWSDFTTLYLGDLTLKPTDTFVVKVKGNTMPHGAVMNLKSVTLTN